MSEVRHDPLSGETVILAPVRGARPHSGDSHSPACSFCPGQEHETPPAVLELSLDPSSGWFVRAFPNLFPIVSELPDGPFESRESSQAAGGVHEVIVETPWHEQEMAQRSAPEIQLTLVAYRERLKALLKKPGIRYVSVFRNKGANAGSSLTHPHSQVVALSYVPRDVTGTVRRWRQYFRETERCLLCDEMSQERKSAERIVLEQDGFVLYTPFGGSMSGELILAPEQHQTSYGSEPDQALSGLSRVLLDAVRRVHGAFADPAYNIVLRTWPRGRQTDGALHWYLRIVPRRAVLGGFELSSGDFVSTLSPEEAAGLYRRGVYR